MRKLLKGYKTIIFNILAGLPFILVELLSYATTVNWNEFLPPERAKLLLVLIPAVNIILRFQTNTAVGQKEPDFKDTPNV